MFHDVTFGGTHCSRWSGNPRGRFQSINLSIAIAKRPFQPFWLALQFLDKNKKMITPKSARWCRIERLKRNHESEWLQSNRMWGKKWFSLSLFISRERQRLGDFLWAQRNKSRHQKHNLATDGSAWLSSLASRRLHIMTGVFFFGFVALFDTIFFGLQHQLANDRCWAIRKRGTRAALGAHFPFYI